MCRRSTSTPFGLSLWCRAGCQARSMLRLLSQLQRPWRRPDSDKISSVRGCSVRVVTPQPSTSDLIVDPIPSMTLRVCGLHYKVSPPRWPLKERPALTRPTRAGASNAEVGARESLRCDRTREMT